VKVLPYFFSGYQLRQSATTPKSPTPSGLFHKLLTKSSGPIAAVVVSKSAQCGYLGDLVHAQGRYGLFAFEQRIKIAQV
jgi:hypothetical protein